MKNAYRVFFLPRRFLHDERGDDSLSASLFCTAVAVCPVMRKIQATLAFAIERPRPGDEAMRTKIFGFHPSVHSLTRVTFCEIGRKINERRPVVVFIYLFICKRLFRRRRLNFATGFIVYTFIFLISSFAFI